MTAAPSRIIKQHSQSYDSILNLFFASGNIFLDAAENIKLGDFGLATRNRDLAVGDLKDGDGTVYDVIEDIRPLLGDPVLPMSARASVDTSAGESMTGGVGTTFYRAPEQEGKVSATSKKGDSSYTVQADIFSFGYVRKRFSMTVVLSLLLTSFSLCVHPKA